MYINNNNDKKRKLVYLPKTSNVTNESCGMIASKLLLKIAISGSNSRCGFQASKRRAAAWFPVVVVF